MSKKLKLVNLIYILTTIKYSLADEKHINFDIFSYQAEQIKYEKDKVDLALLDETKQQRFDLNQEQILKKHAKIFALDSKLQFIECKGVNSRYHISLLTIYLVQPTSFGLQIPKEIKEYDIPILLGYFCILKSEDISLFSTFIEYSQIRLNEYMFFSDIYFGFCYKLFFVLLGTTKFGSSIFDFIRDYKKLNPNILNIKEYIAPFIIITCLIVFMFIVMSISIFLFSRFLLFILIIVGFIAKIWNDITWPSLYIISLQFQIMFSNDREKKVQLNLFLIQGAPKLKSFYLQIQTLLFGLRNEYHSQNEIAQ